MRMKIMLVILAGVLGWALFEFENVEYQVPQAPPMPAQKATGSDAAEAGKSAGDIAAVLLKQSQVMEEPESIEGWGSRDPFFRTPAPVELDETGVVVAPSSNLHLQGIQSTMDGSRKFAVINDGIYQVGDVVDGKILKRIEDRSVILNDNGQEMVLPIKTIEQTAALPRGRRDQPEATEEQGEAEQSQAQAASPVLKMLEKLPLSNTQKQLLQTAGQLLKGGTQP